MQTQFSRSQSSSYLNVLSFQTTKNTENGREKTNTSFTITFSEAIQKGSGNITITDRYGAIFLQESIDSPRISIDGNKLTFTPGVEFAFATSYDLRLSDGLVKSLVGTASLTSGWSTYFQTDYSTIPLNITGTTRDDTIEGGYANDMLNGGTAGADRINGRDGDDVIVGGDETGTTYDGDYLYGGKGNDTISGNGGADYIEGEEGNDKLFGNEGNDRIEGGDGDDEIDGGSGDDYIEDRSGSKNIIKGGDGNDTIKTGTYALNVFGFIDGGNGNDKFYVGAFDTVNGDAGDDTFDISAFASDNSIGKYSGGTGNDIFIFNNMYRSTGGAEISGGEGIDTYAISQYYDRNANFFVTDFKTGSGGDKFDLSKMTKDNSIAGNPFATNGYLKLIQEGADTLLQRVNFGDSTNPTYTILRLKNVQATSLTAENFVGNINPNGSQQGLTLNGTVGNDQIVGNILNDTIGGGDGNDRIEGGGGNDSLFGEAGDDYLYGEGGDDLLDGGAGNDTLEDNFGKNILKGGAGDDILKSSSVSPSTLEGGSGNDTISGGEGVTATLLGNEGNDQIRVSGWSNIQNQMITVDGGSGTDEIIIASQGNSTATIQITGGSERDKFTFNYNYLGNISISDFSTKEGEALDLRSIFSTQPNGNPFGASAFLKARQVANDTVISIDYDGAAGTNYIFRDFLTLKNIKLTELQGVHFYGNWNPDGSSIGVTLDGTENEDTLVGSDLNDVIRGLAGADRINGGSGDDTIHGGDETRGTYGDRIEGGKGNDILFGGNGNDELYGDEGNDQLSGDQGSDRLNGGLGNDTLDGGDDNDSLSDSDGDNTLLGGAGNDSLSSDSRGKSILNGGAGDDYITSTNGNNTLIGGSGDDSFSVGRDSRYDYLNISISISGDDGNDIVQFYDSSSICVVTATGGSGIDTYRLNSRSENKSTLTISDFTTGVGGDVINVFELLYSSTYVGNPFGSAGFLRLQQVGADTVMEFDKDGATGKEYGFQPLVTLKNVLSNTLLPANFTEGLNPDGSPTGLAITGSDTGDDLKGGRLDDTIYGMAGNDTIYGYLGSDKIFGGDGNDSIYGDYGDDDLDGGNGNDIISDSDSLGNNTLNGADGNDNLSTYSSNKNVLKGGNGNDQLMAGNGNDTLLGESGDDILIISNGSYNAQKDNEVYADGGVGNDRFSVSLTSNRKSTITVVGGEGVDTYQISSAVGNSTYTVLDFKAGSGGDIINFNFILPYGFNLGNPFGKLGLLRALQIGQDTTLQWDSDGPQGPKQFQDIITLKNVDLSALTGANFTGGFSADGSNKGMDVTGTDQADKIEGGFLDDTIDGKGGKDSLNGNEGDDQIYGGDGDDTIDGGTGNDTIDGGEGNDYITDQTGASIVTGGAGDDIIAIYGQGPNNISGGDGNDKIYTTINNGVANGGDGNDTFSTSIYHGDRLKRDLQLLGGAGDDLFYVTSDALDQQSVFVTGGSGRDHFSPANMGRDSAFIIEDFQTGENGDFIDLLPIIQSSYLAQSNIETLFTDRYLEFKQQGADTQLLFDADGVGTNSKQTVILTLKGITATSITTNNIAEYLNPKGGNVGIKLYGSEQSDQIKGGLLNDELSGGAGDDLLTGWGGSDIIDGGSGNDTAQYAYPMKYYDILRGTSSFTITAKTGIERQDLVSNVENLKFSDVTINLKMKEQAQTIDPAKLKSLIELYIAFFNRVPDADGMAYWINQIKSGKQLDQISESFYEIGASAQFSNLTGFKSDMTNKDFIDTFYRNVLGRKDGADTDGLNYWNTQLANGASTRSSLAIDILNAAHTFKGNAQLGYVADLLDNKVIVGQKLAIDWGITFNSYVYSRSVQIANAITSTDTSNALKLIGFTDADMAFML